MDKIVQEKDAGLNELMKKFNQSPHLLKMIKDKKVNGEEFYL